MVIAVLCVQHIFMLLMGLILTVFDKPFHQQQSTSCYHYLGY